MCGYKLIYNLEKKNRKSTLKETKEMKYPWFQSQSFFRDEMTVGGGKWKDSSFTLSIYEKLVAMDGEHKTV